MILTTLGRILFAIAIACFGVHYLLFAGGFISAPPGPPWYPHQDPISWAAGIGLIIVAIGLLTNRLARWSGVFLGGALVFRVTYLHVPRVVANIHDPGPWTSLAEIVAIAGGAFALAGALGDSGFFSAPIRRPGQVLFAAPLVLFAVQHILYTHFLATIIPAWIPNHLFWVYFIAGAFIASAVAIITKRLAWAASLLLGIMFLSWVAILHAPRVVTSPHSGNEWTSLFVGLAMAGSAFSVAGGVSRG